MTTSPNILLIVADDMGYGDFGMFNQGASRTPSIDGLARDGVCLTQQYAASPICSPSRAGLLTGRYPHRTGAVSPQEAAGADRIALDEVTIADNLRAAGYATGLVGKWHNGAFDRRHHPNARGFDEFVGFSGGWADYYRSPLDYNGTLRSTDGRYMTDVFTDEAIGFVRRHREDPFFLALTYNAPHTPFQAPADIVQRYEEAGFTRGVAFVYAMIEVMDAGIGRLLEALDDERLSENTIVLFTSDNGPAFEIADYMRDLGGIEGSLVRFNCGFNGAKRSVYEGGIRVPMILRWPAGLEGGGRTIDHLVHFTDWFPTLLGLSGVDRVGGLPLDGRDVSPMLHGDSPRVTPRRFWQWNSYEPIPSHNAAMRDGDWKLVCPEIDGVRPATRRDEQIIRRHAEIDIGRVYGSVDRSDMAPDAWARFTVPPAPSPQLYNIRTDPEEANDRASDEPGRVVRMKAELEDWFEAVEADRTRAVG